MRVSQFQLTKPLPRQSLPSRPRFHPHFVKVTRRAKVLCDPYSVRNVQYCVPPTVWNEYRFSWHLCEFVACKVSVIAVFRLVSAETCCGCFAFNPWQDVHEVVDWFIVLVVPHQISSFDNGLRNMRWKQYPPFLSMNQCIPGTCCQWVDVNACPRSFRSY